MTKRCARLAKQEFTQSSHNRHLLPTLVHQSAPQQPYDVSTKKWVDLELFSRIGSPRTVSTNLRHRMRSAGTAQSSHSSPGILSSNALAVVLQLLFLALPLFAQDQQPGSVAGLVVSTWDGLPMQNVTVTVRGTTLATQTDANGRYELKNVPLGDQVLRFSKSGFAAAVVTDVRVLAGQTTTVNGNLRPEFYEMEEYEVTAEEMTEQTEKILFERQQASSMLDAIGSEQFSRLGAADAGAIMARVTGVSVVGDKYVVVRGLSDRYTRTLLNGLEVPSADPYRTSPQLDLFPSAMIDRINVTKTFTPDQPGGTGGGMIDIITKAFPEKPFLKATIGTSYNENSNLKKNFLADPGSSMDFVAFPSGPKPLDPELFGLTAPPPRPNNAGTLETQTNAVFRRQQAADITAFLQNVGAANFAGVEKDSPLNSSFAASAGQTIRVFDNNFGMFGGLNYNRNFKSVEDAVVNRYTPQGAVKRLGTQDRGNIDTDYGANVNLGYEPWKGTQIGFNFMLVHSTDEEARHGTFTHVEGRDENEILERWLLHFTEREIQNYQLHGHHELPPLLADSKLDWAVGLANTTQNEPDERFMNYFLLPGGRASFGDAALPYPTDPSRYFREIEEQSLNYRADWTLALSFMKEDSKLKAGYFGSNTERDFREQYFTYRSDNGTAGFDPNNPNSYLNDPAYLQYIATFNGQFSRFGVGRTNFSWARFIDQSVANPYTASQDVQAGYLMADLGVLPWLRLIGGARWESTKLKLDAGQEGKADIDQLDFLPAASAVVTLFTNFDVRLSYGETVARPSFRELSPYQAFESDHEITLRGNPNLQMVAVRSYDARVEWYPKPGDIISAGFFYKEVDGAIEWISIEAGDEKYEPFNRTNKTSTLMGFEFEARKSLDFLGRPLRGLSLGANITLIQSTATLNDLELEDKRNVDPGTSRTRPLFDQSPYIINLDLSYDHPTSGTSLTLGSNLTGERLVLVRTSGEDIYEHPPITLDASISQRFLKHFTFRFGIRNLLDSEFLRTYGSSSDGLVYESYRRGRTYSFSLTADW